MVPAPDLSQTEGATTSQPATARVQEQPTAPVGASHDAGLGSAARNGGWGGIGAVVAAALGFLMTAVIARSLGPSLAGTVFAVIALVSILTTLATAGADTGVLWALPRHRALDAGRRVREILTLAMVPVLGLSVVLAATLWIVAPVVARHIGAVDGASLRLLRVMSLGVLVGPTVQVALQATRGMGDVRAFVAIQQVGLPLARFGGVVGLAGLGLLTPVAAGWAWTAPLVIASAASVAVVRSRSRRSEPVGPRPARDRALARSFWIYSIMRGLASACSMALLWCDVLLVAVLASPAAAGVYAVASRFATSGQIALQAMRLGIAPQVSVAFARKDTERVQVLYSVTTIWAIVLCWPIFATLAVFAPALLGLFGQRYPAGATALAILSAGMMVSVGVGNVGTLLLMSGRSTWVARNVAAALAVNLALNLILIPLIGINGAALAWAASILVENLLGLYVVRRGLGVRGHERRLRSVAVLTLTISLGLALAVRAVLGATLPALGVHTVLLAVAMAGLVHSRRHDLRLGVVLARRSRVRPA